MNKRLQWFIFIKEGWRNPLVYFMLSNYERDDFCSTFTVFDFGQFLTFPEMSLTFILLPPDCLFIVFKHSWVYISHNYTLLRFFRNILKYWLQSIVMFILKKGWTWDRFWGHKNLKSDALSHLWSDLRHLVPDLLSIITKFCIFGPMDKVANALTKKGWALRWWKCFELAPW